MNNDLGTGDSDKVVAYDYELLLVASIQRFPNFYLIGFVDLYSSEMAVWLLQ